MTVSIPGLPSFVSLKVGLLGFPLQEHNDFVTKYYWSVHFWKPRSPAKVSTKPGLL